MSGLYIHIPFCASKCRYCDFYSIASPKTDAVDGFLKALKLELRRFPNGFAPKTVFIGGGTPTVLLAPQLATLMEALNDTIDLTQVSEFSCELNPGTLSPEKIAELKTGGVNRVSIGVQSFNDKALRLLGRIHDANEAVTAFNLLREAGFENINLDLIQSIPGMTPEQVLQDVRQAIALGVEHISSYNLIYEQGTPLTDDLEAGRLLPIEEDEEADGYYAVKQLLESIGYNHYEISNFCRPGYECRHNQLYWRGGAYLGCGPAAHSHWDGARFGNVPDLQDYCTRLENGERPFDDVERLSPEDKARETLVMGLRQTAGVNIAAFERSTGWCIKTLCGDSVERFIEEGLLEQTHGWLHLNHDALFISDAVFSELI